LERLVADYLAEMAIKPALMGMMQPIKPTQHVELKPAGMAWVRLTTDPAAADALTGPTICKSPPRPANCRDLFAKL
jgi:hypothetical protein